MIIFQHLLNRVRELAEVYPDTVTNPWFCDWEKPVCIIGVAAADLGVHIPERLRFAAAHSVDWVALGFSEPFGPQLQWLDFVQDGQDARWSWGRSVARANERFPFVGAA